MTPSSGSIADQLRADGLDLTATTTAQQYNPLVDEPFRLPDYGRSSTLVLVIGNTKALWPHITKVWDEPDYAADPVDTYCDQAIERAIAAVDVSYDLRLYHEAPPRRIAMQRLAQVAGLAGLSESHLCVHPEFGPWIALRAAVVFDTDGEASTPASVPCDCAVGCQPALTAALDAGEPKTGTDVATNWHAWLAVRDACPVGQSHRYSAQQIRYHYTEEKT